uniref:Transmembrane protein n=1 Tax=Pithovirus LCPAC102 TaxID=2506587 RepID=A0A4D5XFH2_9VIRU|nr:MAG: hypothetical protein LCPAC102_01810 [Pithovirus LCPAC102]
MSFGYNSPIIGYPVSNTPLLSSDYDLYPSEYKSLNPDISTEHPVPDKDEFNLNKSSNVNNTPNNILVLFILGALIFLVLFAWFNIIKILIDIFYETLYPTSIQPDQNHPTQRDFNVALIKQLTYTFIITIILYIFFKFIYKI